MQSTEGDRTKRKFPFRSVRLEVTIGSFPQNYRYPLRPKIDFKEICRFTLIRCDLDHKISAPLEKPSS
uniref:Uncharacterized protein n=1 Tax=Romanomermis culicivorax TaxID=13658 RepID=A0A915J055_ROMCU